MRAIRFLHRTWVLVVAALLIVFGMTWASTVLASPVGAKGHTPVTICHHAGPNPANWHTITVDDDSVTLQAHLSHGDTLGPCTNTTTPTPTPTARPSAPTPTPTPIADPTVDPSATPTSTATESARPTPLVIGLPVDSTLPPTDTSTGTDRAGNPVRALILIGLVLALFVVAWRIATGRVQR